MAKSCGRGAIQLRKTSKSIGRGAIPLKIRRSGAVIRPPPRISPKTDVATTLRSSLSETITRERFSFDPRLPRTNPGSQTPPLEGTT